MAVALDLSPYGWTGCSIREDLRGLRASLPSWRHLHLLRTLPTSSLYMPLSPFTDLSGVRYMPAYKKGVVHNDRGTYSTLYRGGRVVYDCKPSAATGHVDLVLKTPLSECAIKEMKLHISPAEDAATPTTRSHSYSDEINAIVYETIIHLLVCRTLTKAGHPSFVPTFHEIVAVGEALSTTQTKPLDSPTRVKALWSVMEVLKGETLQDVCRKRLTPCANATTSEGRKAIETANEDFLIDAVTQLAFVLYILF